MMWEHRQKGAGERAPEKLPGRKCAGEDKAGKERRKRGADSGKEAEP